MGSSSLTARLSDLFSRSNKNFTMASTLSGPNIEEEYMWAVTLSATSKEYDWAPKEAAPDTEDEDEEETDPSCKPNHRLLIKQAILHPEAKEGEVTLLQVETIGYNKEKVVAPIVAMKAGNDPQKYIDLLVPDSAKIKVISGSGPITLIGSHCVDFYDYRNYGAEDEDDEDEDAASSEDDAVDMEEQEAAAPPAKEEKKKPPVKEQKSPSKEEDKEASPESKGKVTPSKKGKKGAAVEKGDEKAEEKPPSGKKDKKRKAS